MTRRLCSALHLRLASDTPRRSGIHMEWTGQLFYGHVRLE